jgi:hypothetical protein
MQNIGSIDRIETGPLDLIRDWPGYFIRGDEALGEASTMRRLADAIERGDEAVIKAVPIYLRNLASALETCRVE